MDIATLSAAFFEPLIGERVTVGTPGGPMGLVIERVEHMGEAPEGGRAPFALVLSGPLSPQLAQGSWPMQVPGLGETALFLSPYAQTEDITRYEILFG